MPLRTAGFRLSTMPEANVDFRLPAARNALGPGLKEGLLRFAQQRKEKADKQRQADILIAVQGASQGDDTALKGLPPEDQVVAGQMLQELLDKQAKREATEVASALKAGELASKKKEAAIGDLVNQITFSDEGEMEALPFDPSKVEAPVLQAAFREAEAQNIKRRKAEADVKKAEKAALGDQDEKSFVELTDPEKKGTGIFIIPGGGTQTFKRDKDGKFEPIDKVAGREQFSIIPVLDLRGRPTNSSIVQRVSVDDGVYTISQTKISNDQAEVIIGGSDDVAVVEPMPAKSAEKPTMTMEEAEEAAQSNSLPVGTEIVIVDKDGNFVSNGIIE